MCSTNTLEPFCAQCKRGFKGKKCEEPETFERDLALGVTIGVFSLFVVLTTLIALPFIVFYCKKQRKQKAQEIELKQLLSERLVAEDGEMSMHEEWIIDRDELEFEERISEGTFGIVFKGTYKKKMPVAIKKLKISDTHGDFESEVKILKSLRHPVSNFCDYANLVEYHFVHGSMYARRVQVYCH